MPADQNTNDEVEAQNQAAANSGPLESSPAPDAPVGAQLTQEASLALAAGSAAASSTQPVLDEKAAKAMSRISVAKTAIDEDFLDQLHTYRKALENRIKRDASHLLDGMANSTAMALRSLADAEVHLADHIHQQQPKE